MVNTIRDFYQEWARNGQKILATFILGHGFDLEGYLMFDRMV